MRTKRERYDDDRSMVETIGQLTVHEPAPALTGLVDKHGRPFVRPMQPIGFIRHKERP
jgi:hypothetical protein